MQVQKPEEALDLGTWIGRKQAFASIAGGCSAADAECLRQLREQKKYRGLGLSWEEFCKQRIGIQRQHADRLIRRLEEFGPRYFRLAQATGITPEEYRRIAGSVSEKGLAHAGESIPINAEEAPRPRAAVEEIARVEHLPLSAARQEKLSDGVAAQVRRGVRHGSGTAGQRRGAEWHRARRLATDAVSRQSVSWPIANRPQLAKLPHNLAVRLAYSYARPRATLPVNCAGVHFYVAHPVRRLRMVQAIGLGLKP